MSRPIIVDEEQEKTEVIIRPDLFRPDAEDEEWQSLDDFLILLEDFWQTTDLSEVWGWY